MQIAQFVTMGPDNEEYFVRLEADETDNEREVDVTYSIARKSEEVAMAKVNFDLQNGAIQMTGLEVALTGYLACLITCGLGHIIQELLDCWRKGHRTPRALLACLKAKGISSTPNLVNCSIACLGGVVVGSP